MVLVPLGRDQPVVAARASALGVAEVVPRDDASTEALSAANDAVLGNGAMHLEAERQGARLRASYPARVTAWPCRRQYIRNE
jgi:UDP:flavonoid glycosyltransferase YjiC (YdhE family)